MPNSGKQVRPNLMSKSDTSAALAASWGRMINTHGRGGWADKLGIDASTVKRAMGGESLPELHTALNSLLIDPTALNDVFARLGFHPPRPRFDQPANDLHTMSGLSNVLGTFCEALEDGHRDHKETLELADLIRPLMPALSAIMSEANKLRGVAA